jgi:hypothetical protein
VASEKYACPASKELALHYTGYRRQNCEQGAVGLDSYHTAQRVRKNLFLDSYSGHNFQHNFREQDGEPVCEILYGKSLDALYVEDGVGRCKAQHADHGYRHYYPLVHHIHNDCLEYFEVTASPYALMMAEHLVEHQFVYGKMEELENGPELAEWYWWLPVLGPELSTLEQEVPQEHLDMGQHRWDYSVRVDV